MCQKVCRRYWLKGNSTTRERFDHAYCYSVIAAQAQRTCARSHAHQCKETSAIQIFFAKKKIGLLVQRKCVVNLIQISFYSGRVCKLITNFSKRKKTWQRLLYQLVGHCWREKFRPGRFRWISSFHSTARICPSPVFPFTPVSSFTLLVSVEEFNTHLLSSKEV